MVVRTLPSVHAEFISGLCRCSERTTLVACISADREAGDEYANPAVQASGRSEACQSPRRQVCAPFARRVLDENLPRAGADSSPRACAERPNRAPENRAEEAPTARRRIGRRPLATGPVGRRGRGMRAAERLRTALRRPRAARVQQAGCAGLPRRRNHPHTVRSHYHTKSERQLRKSPRGRRCYDAATASR